MHSASASPTSDEEITLEKGSKLIKFSQTDVDLFHRSMCEPEPKLCLQCPSEFKPPTAYLSDRRQQYLYKRTGKPLNLEGLQFNKTF
jgi:hypothetical protein